MLSYKPLVSIITPCFNGELYISRFFNSILRQTYPNIELIFVNDGSTDDTERIALSYRQALEEKGYSFQYIYQENQGQASAINQGLKLISGDYLTWPDSDDWMTDNCIERKVELMENHPQWGFLCCRTAAVAEDDIDRVQFLYERKSKDSEHFFYDLILEKDVYFAPGGYMVRAKELLSALKDGQIYEGRGGQNWQLLLPMAYQYQCGFVDDILYYYLVRTTSHSHSTQSLESRIERSFEHERTLIHTIDRLNAPKEDKDVYFDVIRRKYLNKRYKLASQANNKRMMQRTFIDLNTAGFVDFEGKLDHYRKVSKPVYYFLRLLHLPIGAMRRLRAKLK